MSDRLIHNDSNDPLHDHWESFRKKDLSNSFHLVSDWIRENAEHRNFYKQKRKRAIRNRWLAVSVIPLLLIITSAFKVDRKERFGDLINFGLEKKMIGSHEKIKAIQGRFGLSFHQLIRPVQPQYTFFLALVKKSGNAIVEQLSTLEGISNLKSTEINYTVRESIFSSFIHETLNIGDPPKPKTAEIEGIVEKELKSQLLVDIDITISLNTDQPLVINSIKNDEFTNDLPIDSHSTDTSMRSSLSVKSLPQNTTVKSNEANKLQDFEWLLGTWKLIYVPVETYHHWIRISDTVLKCYILSRPDGQANLTTGFYLKQGLSNETELHLKKEVWKFISSANKVYSFSREEEGDRTNLTMTIKDNNSWQSQIYGRNNKEFMNFLREQSSEVEELVKMMRKNHPDKDTKY